MRLANHPRALATAMFGVLLLAACGSSDPSGAAGTIAPSATFQTNDSTAELDVGAAAPTAPGPDEPPSSDAVAADSAAADPAADPADDPAADPAAEPVPVVEPAMLGGRAFAEAVDPGANVETNQLPDLVVDDVRRDAKANFRNIFPADRPVLLWLWAPH